MKSIITEQKLIKGPVTVTTITSHILARLLTAAVKKTDEGRPVLNLNQPQCDKYNLYEFTFGPQDQYDGELKNLFEDEFKDQDEAKAVFEELQALLPDGVKLLYTSDKTSIFPRYEFQGRLVLLSIYLSARQYLTDPTLKTYYLPQVIKKLDEIWETAAQEVKTLYNNPLTNIQSAEEQFTLVENVVYDFQNQVRVYLATLICKECIPTKKELELIAETLSDYEQKPKLDISPELAELERELNCDLFRLDADGRFQFYKRHLPMTAHQKKRIAPKITLEEKKEYLPSASSSSSSSSSSLSSPPSSRPLTGGRLLYPTITAHADSNTLPNFVEVCEGTYTTNSRELTIAFCSIRHGTPMFLQKLVTNMTQDEYSKFKHNSVYQVFLNYEQELLIIRAREIEFSLLKYNASPAYKQKMPSLYQIHRFSLGFSTEITEQMHNKLLIGNFDDAKENYKIFTAAYNHQEPIPKAAYFYLVAEFTSILFVQNFYTHIISGHDDATLYKALLQLQNLTGKKKDIEEYQFRACRTAQYAFDYTSEKRGFIYLCSPLNLAQIPNTDIANSIRTTLIEACLTYKIIFAKDELLKPLEPLFKKYHASRVALSSVAKKYIRACELKEDVKVLNILRKEEFKPAEKDFFKSAAFLETFKTLNTIIKSSKPTTPAGILLKVIFQIFDNNAGAFNEKYNGMLTALFHFFTHALNLEGKMAVSASGGCKSGHDRWQKIALILTRMIKVGITTELLSKLDAVMEDFGDDLHVNLSGVHTALGVCTIPKTDFDILAFKNLKVNKLSLPDLKSPPFNDKHYELYKQLDPLAAHQRRDYLNKKWLPSLDEFIFLCARKNTGFSFWCTDLKPSTALALLTTQFYAYCAYDWLNVMEDDTEKKDDTEKEDGDDFPLSRTTVNAMNTVHYSHEQYKQNMLEEIQNYYPLPGTTPKKKSNNEDLLAIRWLSEYFHREKIVHNLKSSSGEFKQAPPEESKLNQVLLNSKQYFTDESKKLKPLLDEVDEKSIAIGGFSLLKKYEILFSLIDKCFVIKITLERQVILNQGIFSLAPLDAEELFSKKEIIYANHITNISLEDPMAFLGKLHTTSKPIPPTPPKTTVSNSSLTTS